MAVKMWLECEPQGCEARNSKVVANWVKIWFNVIYES